jgi:hypothetical protein
MKDYFVKEESSNTVEETKTIEDSKIEIVKITDPEIIENLPKLNTSKIKDDYIEPDNAKIFENLDPNLLPEKEDKITKKISSIKNIKDNQLTEGLYSQESTSQIKDTLSKDNEILYSKDNLDRNIKERPHLAEALKAIRTNPKRLEYGSPSVANIGLPKSELSPLILNQASTSNLPDINDGIDLEENNVENKDSQEKLPLHN